jgi:hypothetical protein
VFGGGLDVSAGRVDHQNPQPRGRIHVDVVHADARARDHLEAARGVQQIRRDLGLGPDEQRVVLRDDFDQLSRRQTLPLVDVERPAQQGQPVRREFLRAQHARSGGLAIAIARRAARRHLGGEKTKWRCHGRDPCGDFLVN